MPFGRRSPLEALALPGVILAYKYSQFRQRRREAASRRVTERELSALHHKIDKLLHKLEESEPEPPTSQEDECVICINARATMQTSPCGHRVVCRRCFVKTIQSAVAQRLLPLRCVICRARINRLTSGSAVWRIQESASSYSMATSKSWNLSGSSSSYSVGAKVAQSTSLYSMSSGSSCVSADSSFSNCSSNLSGISSSDALSSTTSSSKFSNNSSSSNNNITSNNNNNNNHNNNNHHHSHHRHGGGGSCGNSSSSSSNSSTPSENYGCCSDGSCNGAYPRNPQYHHYKRNRGRISELQNRLPPIKEFRSPTKVPVTSPIHQSKIRFASYTKNSKTNENSPLLKDMDILNYPNTPSTLSSSSNRSILSKSPSSPAVGSAAAAAASTLSSSATSSSSSSTTSILRHSTSKLGTSKIAPIALKSPINMATSMSGRSEKYSETCFDKSFNKIINNNNFDKNKLLSSAVSAVQLTSPPSSAASVSKLNNNSISKTIKSHQSLSSSPLAATSSSIAPSSASSHRGLLFLNGKSSTLSICDERADNRKNENAEKKKRDEKSKLKAEKETRKEEKRIAKEEERLAKLLAKEEKKKGKREAKELLLLSSDGSRRK